MVVYFSGTGNSKYIAERIAGSLQEKLLCMNERIKSGDTGSVKTGENLIVVVPTYAWRIPRVVSDWIGQTEFVGAKNVWYVMSCGSGIGGADIYNRKLSEKKGIKHMGTAQIIMPENYIAMFNAPDVEKAKKIVVAAGPAIAKAVLAIKHGEHLPERKYGLGGRMESGLVNSVFYPVFVKAKAFYADQTCTGCGKCVKVCPLNNVTMKDKIPVCGSHCTDCMACICHCPAEAIEYGRKSVGKPRYCFENLGIEEKGTLPGIPSEKEVKANGVNLAETDVLLLQKIEELTLYIIELKQEIEDLKSQVNN